MKRKAGKWIGIFLVVVGLWLRAEAAMLYAHRIWFYLLVALVVAFAALLEFLSLKKTLLAWVPLAIGGVLLCTPFTASSHGFLSVTASSPYVLPCSAFYRPVDASVDSGHVMNVPVQAKGAVTIIRAPRRIHIFGRQWELETLNIWRPLSVSLTLPRQNSAARAFTGKDFSVFVECIRYPDAQTADARETMCRAIKSAGEIKYSPYPLSSVALPAGEYDVLLSAQSTDVYGVPNRPRDPFRIPKGEGVTVETRNYFYSLLSG